MYRDCRQYLAKVFRFSITLLLYVTVYLVVSYEISPEVTVSFVSEDFRLGDKFALIYFVAPKSPAFSDAEGAEVFSSRRCGKCFVTNNKGFVPLSEYDAVLMLGDRRLVSKTSMPYVGNKYLIETTKKCAHSKLKGCIKEPRITSLATKKTYDLCGFCEHLHALRKPKV